MWNKDENPREGISSFRGYISARGTDTVNTACSFTGALSSLSSSEDLYKCHLVPPFLPYPLAVSATRDTCSCTDARFTKAQGAALSSALCNRNRILCHFTGSPPSLLLLLFRELVLIHTQAAHGTPRPPPSATTRSYPFRSLPLHLVSEF